MSSSGRSGLLIFAVCTCAFLGLFTLTEADDSGAAKAEAFDKFIQHLEKGGKTVTKQVWKSAIEFVKKVGPADEEMLLKLCRALGPTTFLTENMHDTEVPDNTLRFIGFEPGQKKFDVDGHLIKDMMMAVADAMPPMYSIEVQEHCCWALANLPGLDLARITPPVRGFVDPLDDNPNLLAFLEAVSSKVARKGVQSVLKALEQHPKSEALAISASTALAGFGFMAAEEKYQGESVRGGLLIATSHSHNETLVFKGLLVAAMPGVWNFYRLIKKVGMDKQQSVKSFLSTKLVVRGVGLAETVVPLLDMHCNLSLRVVVASLAVLIRTDMGSLNSSDVTKIISTLSLAVQLYPDSKDLQLFMALFLNELLASYYEGFFKPHIVLGPEIIKAIARQLHPNRCKMVPSLAGDVRFRQYCPRVWDSPMFGQIIFTIVIILLIGIYHFR
mmetsp:Transcript_19829/g.32516  ORF Transcript_19829/g.32516 Transcript_19829/m.32516 type:complete len:443 (-) Transcript_19829:71-1399(-)